MLPVSFFGEPYFEKALMRNFSASALDPKVGGVRVIAQSGVLASDSSGDQIDVRHLNTVFELYSGYHLGQVLEAA
jgi:hypothetical protein